jgi:hypothetical protein
MARRIGLLLPVAVLLVPGRTKTQCKSRWSDVLSSKTDETTARVGKWTTVENSTLKNEADLGLVLLRAGSVSNKNIV